ncbi:E3 ubiquitin ligase complex SCF subunit sconC [Drosophila serrata]|uniref:E3 ubiquitin ligase complex SCF subunit sconC n=1 Tax=Drosophila serrata TaxID=7274 RepID=UPI000A1D2A1A|nr:E3 ubiquitin ligase complex SCF subunit sconC [Drosophila serrata]KAH8391586.1 hypothetical protein KR200_011976 [Drosophila serrata]
MDEMVRMQAGDGKSVRAPFGLLDRSKVIQGMGRRIRPSFASTKDNDKDNGKNPGKDNDDEEVMPLHGIKSLEVLLKVLLWAEFHVKDDEPAWVAKVEPVTAYEMELQVDDWDKEFLREKIEFVCALMEAADYLDIPWLYKLAAYKIALHCRRIKHAVNGLKQCQEKIHSMAMFEWTGETSEPESLEKIPTEKPVYDTTPSVHVVVINCAIVRQG